MLSLLIQTSVRYGSFCKPDATWGANVRISTGIEDGVRFKSGSTWINSCMGLALRFPERLRKAMPAGLVFYGVLGLADFGLTLAAFQHGATEANPMLRHVQGVGLFEFLKLALTLLVVTLGYKLWHLPITRTVIGFANGMMVALVVYHIASLQQFG